MGKLSLAVLLFLCFEPTVNGINTANVLQSSTSVDDHTCQIPNGCCEGYFRVASSCAACPIGKTPSSTTGASCDACASGYTGSGGACTACPAGTYKKDVNSNLCTNCPPGSYASKIATAECTSCPIDYYASGAGSISCAACNTREYTTQAGATECYDTENVPDFYLQLFTIILLAASMTALHIRAVVANHEASLWARIGGSIFYMLSFVAIASTTISAMPSPARQSIIGVFAGIYLLYAIVPMAKLVPEGFQPKFVKDFRETSTMENILLILCLVFVIFMQFRLSGFRDSLKSGDLIILELLFVLVQVAMTYVFVETPEIGTHIDLSIIPIVLALIALICLVPIGALEHSITSSESEFQIHDYQNVDMGLAIFGLVSTAFLFAIKVLEKMNSGLGTGVGKFKKFKDAEIQLEHLLGRQPNCGGGLHNDGLKSWAAETKLEMSKILTELGGETVMAGSKKKITCHFVDALTEPVVRWGVIGKPNSKSTIKLCGAIPATNLVAIRAGTAYNAQTDCTNTGSVAAHLLALVQNFITNNTPKGKLASGLDSGLTDTVTKQLLIAVGFYGAVNSLIQTGFKNKKNYANMNFGLLAQAIFMCCTVAAGFLIWLLIIFVKADSSALEAKYTRKYVPKDIGACPAFTEHDPDDLTICCRTNCFPPVEQRNPADCTQCQPCNPCQPKVTKIDPVDCTKCIPCAPCGLNHGITASCACQPCLTNCHNPPYTQVDPNDCLVCTQCVACGQGEIHDPNDCTKCVRDNSGSDSI